MKMTEYQALVGQDIQIAQNQWSASAAVTLSPPLTTAVQVMGLHFKFAYAGGATGTALHPTGGLYFFRGNPAIAAATAKTGLTEVQVNMLMGYFDVASDDWEDLATGICEVALYGGIWQGSGRIDLVGQQTVYVAFLYEGATTINSAAGDQEVLSVRFLYE